MDTYYANLLSNLVYYTLEEEKNEGTNLSKLQAFGQKGPLG